MYNYNIDFINCISGSHSFFGFDQRGDDGRRENVIADVVNDAYASDGL